MRRRKILQYLAAGGLSAFFAVFLVWPVYTVVAEGLNWTMLLEIFRSPIYLEGLWNSLAVAVVTTLLVLIVVAVLQQWQEDHRAHGKTN